jgi:hypothetical protein
VERPPDRFEVFVDPRYPSGVPVLVSHQAGSIAGKVTAGGNAVPAAPVFLWPVTDAARRSLGGALMMITDTEGTYEFHSLPPGEYRLLASFDVYEFDEELVELSKSPITTVKPGMNAERNLTLWDAPW